MKPANALLGMVACAAISHTLVAQDLRPPQLGVTAERIALGRITGLRADDFAAVLMRRIAKEGVPVLRPDSVRAALAGMTFTGDTFALGNAAALRGVMPSTVILLLDVTRANVEQRHEFVPPRAPCRLTVVDCAANRLSITDADVSVAVTVIDLATGQSWRRVVHGSTTNTATNVNGGAYAPYPDGDREFTNAANDASAEIVRLIRPWRQH